MPYLFATSSLNLCPFTTHAYLEVPNETIRDAVIEKLVNGSESSSDGSSGGLELNFIRGSDIQCDWSGSGLEGGKPKCQNLTKGGLAESLSGESGSYRSTKVSKQHILLAIMMTFLDCGSCINPKMLYIQNCCWNMVTHSLILSFLA